MTRRDELLWREALSLQDVVEKPADEKAYLERKIELMLLDEERQQRESRQRIESVQQRHHEVTNAMRQEIFHLTHQRDHIQHQVFDLKDQQQQHLLALGHNREAAVETSDELTHRYTEIGRLDSLIRTYNDQIDDLSARKTALTLEVAKVQHVHEETLASINALMSKMPEIIKMIDDYTARLEMLKKTHNVEVKNVLTEMNKRLLERYNKRMGMNTALDVQIAQKQKKRRKP